MMKFRLPAIVVACAMLVACAQQPTQPASPPASPSVKSTGKPQPKVAIAIRAPHKPSLPKLDLSEQLMFKFMLAEVAEQRGQPQIAVPAYLELARETRDPRIARRATEVAWNARSVKAALEAAGIWLETDPKSTRARQFMAVLLVNQEQLAEAQPHLEKWLAADPVNVGQSFLQLSTLLARHKDKAEVSRLMQELARPYPKVPEARITAAQAAWNADQQELALDEVRAALRLKPDWELAVLFQAQMLQKRSSAEALQYLEGYVQTHPQAKDVRLNYARLLVNDKKYAEARKQFEALLNEFPQNADVTMAVALLAIQVGDYDAAETRLKHALEIHYKDPDTVRLYLGQVNEERKRFDEALKWYGSVGQGAQYINAQTRYAGVLAKQGSLAEARAHLQQIHVQNSEQRVQLTQAEAQLLRDANEYKQAYDLLSRALEKQPDAPDLLYDHAMAAEKVDRIDVLESNLRKLIQIRPDYAHAYNALGYTFADRNERLPEARTLIEMALKLSPEDPFILDSMGWVLYRSGDYGKGIGYLQRAFALRPDPEIAAHLGEVLWVSGQHDQARKIWADVLKEYPKNDVLQKTVKRFVP